MISKKLIAASILAAMGTSAHAIDFKAGDWTLGVSGSVNAFYSSTSCDNNSTGSSGYAAVLSVCGSIGAGQDGSSIQNGLLPGFINFTASTTQKGYDIKANVGVHPGTSNEGGFDLGAGPGGLPAQAVGGGVGNSVGDARQIWLSFGNAEMGTIKLGRDIGLFQQQAILNDMTLLGVGTGGGFSGALNTTTGMIGNGYIYAEFKPQITYTLPTAKELTVSVGVYQPSRTVGAALNTLSGAGANPTTPGGPQRFGGTTTRPGLNGLASYDFGTAKVWGSFLNQEYEDQTARIKYETNGFELGGKASFGALELMAVGFTGEGLGSGVAAVDGFSSTNAAAGQDAQQRDSNGYLLQATYKIGDTKFGINHGMSKLDLAANETAAGAKGGALLNESTATTLGVYHSLTPNLTLVGEYIMAEQSAHGPNRPDVKADTVAIGAIIFF
jgi:hypothetical protein